MVRGREQLWRTDCQNRCEKRVCFLFFCTSLLSWCVFCHGFTFVYVFLRSKVSPPPWFIVTAALCFISVVPVRSKILFLVCRVLENRKMEYDRISCFTTAISC